MQLVGRDSHFGAQAVFAAVGKAGAGVHHHAAAIDVRDKVILHAHVFSHHGFGVAAAVLLDMLAGFGHIVHELDACLEGQVFVVVIAVVADVLDTAVVALGVVIAKEFYATVGEAVEQLLDVGCINVAVDNYAFHGVAHAGALRLRVNEDVYGLVHVGGLVHIHVADAVEVLDDGNLALFHHGADQAFATAGDYQVDAVATLQQHAHQVVAGFGHQLHGVFVNAVFGKGLVENPGEALGGIQGFFATAQNHGVSRLETEAGTVNRYVGAAFKNKEHRADGYCHTANLDSVLQFAAFQHPVQRVGKGGNFFGALGHGFDAGVVQCQTVHLGVVQLAGGGFQVKLVGGQDFRLVFPEQLCYQVQHGTPLFAGEGAQVLACFFGVFRQKVGIFVQVGIIFSHVFNIETCFFTKRSVFSKYRFVFTLDIEW